jgi:hypothetical protein
MNFLQLSQAPPELDIEIANCTPLIREPINSPTTKIGWNKMPNISGVRITISPGRIISHKEALVETLMQAS